MRPLEFITARLKVDTLNGRILDIPGSGITITDDQGRVLARNFKFTLTGTRMAQPDPSRAAFNTAQLKVVKATNTGGRETWNVTVPMRRLIENTSDVIREIVGEDAEFDQTEPYSKLLIAMLKASKPETEHNCPTYHEMQFSENGRWFYASDAEVGRQAVSIAANAEVEIVRLIKNEETGETSYRLRVPRTDGAEKSGGSSTTRKVKPFTSRHARHGQRTRSAVSENVLEKWRQGRFAGSHQSERQWVNCSIW